MSAKNNMAQQRMLQSVNAILAAKAFSGILDGLFLDNYSVGGMIEYPWASLAGSPGTAGTDTGGGFGVANDTALIGVCFPNLTSLAGSVKVYNCPALIDWDTPLLASIAGCLSVYNNDALASLALPLLTNAARLEIYGHAALTTLNVSALVSCSGNLTISSNDALATLDLGALTTLSGGGQFQIYNNTLLTSLDLSALASLTGSFSIFGNGFTSLSLSAFTTLGASSTLSIYGNNALTNIDLSTLGSVPSGCSLEVKSNPVLTSLNILSLTNLAGNFDANGCTTLTTPTLPAIFNLTDGFILNFDSCALDTASVDAILTACAAGIGGTTSGTIYLSGGTNSSPTGGATNADYLTLVGAGITVNIN